MQEEKIDWHNYVGVRGKEHTFGKIGQMGVQVLICKRAEDNVKKIKFKKKAN